MTIWKTCADKTAFHRTPPLSPLGSPLAQLFYNCYSLMLVSECLNARHSIQSINMFTVVSASHFFTAVANGMSVRALNSKRNSKQRLERVGFHATFHLSPAFRLHCGKNRLLLHHWLVLLVFFNWCVCECACVSANESITAVATEQIVLIAPCRC